MVKKTRQGKKNLVEAEPIFSSALPKTIKEKQDGRQQDYQSSVPTEGAFFDKKDGTPAAVVKAPRKPLAPRRSKGGRGKIRILKNRRQSFTVADSQIKDLKRIKFGIPGFDDLIQGGVPAGTSILMSGPSGAGKTIFCLHFLFTGATANEPGIYVSFEETADSIKQTARLFGWDIDQLEKENKLAIIWKDPYEIKNFATSLTGELYYRIKDMGAKRIVIDPITYMGEAVKDKQKLRKVLVDLSKRFNALGATVLFISERPEGVKSVGKIGIEEFITDGVIILHNILSGDIRTRAIELLKMRHTSHDTMLHPFKITSRGLVVFPREQVFATKT
ncbi:AAA family ATPase [Candidatus Micrarchaeota archaeon]|nr:AAA family ATPase [Candidatus Micrarchaeota archaeon]